jgi:hypothetical protein
MKICFVSSNSPQATTGLQEERLACLHMYMHAQGQSIFLFVSGLDLDARTLVTRQNAVSLSLLKPQKYQLPQSARKQPIY